MTEETKKKPSQYSYQAEVSKVLDIVINSLYTDREIFVRELVSNAADALEKARHTTLTQEAVRDKDLPLEIRIKLDEEKKQFSISDTGIGLSQQEVIDNLGKVAHSGSSNFLETLAENLKKDVNLIGQFGVGFYSAFMVANEVEVTTQSIDPDSGAVVWRSSGADGFTVDPVDEMSRGTTMLLSLKDDAEEFAKVDTIKRIIKQYSNFVSFPIYVNDEQVNTTKAIWTRSKNEIEDSEYKDFYKFAAGYGEPLTWLHFSTDAPLGMHVLLYVGGNNPESLGFGKLESSVDLYCRKVLIEKECKGLLPPWLRFVRGVIDSEDIPLNISRETMQDTQLVRKINKAVTRRFLKHMKELAKSDADQYLAIWKEFGTFFKEGIITDHDHRENLADLLRFETSRTESGKMISLSEYVDRAGMDQKVIYFIAGPNREAIEAGPYMEIFKKREVEVIYNYEPVDDFVMTHLGTFQEKTFVSADSEKIDLPEEDKKDKDEDENAADKETVKSTADWIRKTLQDQVLDVKASERLVNSSMILVNPEGGMTGAMERLLQASGKGMGMGSNVKRNLEFNPNHVMIQKLNTLKDSDPAFAEKMLKQLYDHAALDAGISIETKSMIQRIEEIMSRFME